MREIEVKILSIDLDKIISILESHKLERVKNESQINTIYDFPDFRLKAAKGYARVREVKDMVTGKEKSYLTVKKMISQEKYKEMDEAETIIESPMEGHHLFKSLGLIVRKVVAKNRISYRYKNSLIELDSVNHEEYPFPLLEIESQHEDELKEIVSLLGYTMDDTTSMTMTEIVAQKEKEEGNK